MKIKEMLKNLILDYKINVGQQKESKVNNRDTKKYDQAQQIGVVYWNRPQTEISTINLLIDELINDGKTVSVLQFQNTTAKEKEKRHGQFTFTPKDLSVLGTWKEAFIEEFVRTPFDYLLHLDLERNKYIDYIFATSKAKCRIGSYMDINQHHYELIVSLNGPEKNLNDYISEIKKYLKIIGNHEQ